MVKDGFQMKHRIPLNNLLKISIVAVEAVDDNLLLLGHTNSFSLVASGLGVLSSGSEAPVVTQTTMGADLLETLQVLTKLVVQDVGHHLGGLAVLVITLSVEEPVGNLVLAGVLKRKVKFLLANI